MVNFNLGKSPNSCLATKEDTDKNTNAIHSIIMLERETNFRGVLCQLCFFGLQSVGGRTQLPRMTKELRMASCCILWKSGRR